MAGNSNSGRKTDDVKHKFQRILQEANADQKFKQILIHTKNEKIFIQAFELASSYAYGKPQQSVQLSGDQKRPLQFAPAPDLQEYVERVEKDFVLDGEDGATLAEEE